MAAPTGSADTGEVEDYQVTILARDLGDAPDTGTGTGVGNYNTTAGTAGRSTPSSPTCGWAWWIRTLITARCRTRRPTPTTRRDRRRGRRDHAADDPDDLDQRGAERQRVQQHRGGGDLACWLDFNRDGDFADTGERISTTASREAADDQTLTFTGFAAPTAGMSYLRCRLANTATEVTNPTGVANTGEVEDYRVTIVGVDFGDAVDATAGTGAGNYNTRLADNGPSHTIVPNLQLGANAPDGDSGLLNNAAADADDTTNSGVADDEDGVTTLPVVRTTSPSVPLSVSVLNDDGADATVACWIDFNRDGDFLDAGERAAALVPSGAGQQTVSLTFSGYAAPTAGVSYLRCRVANAAGEVTNPTGAAATGEVEDYPGHHRCRGLRRRAGHRGGHGPGRLQHDRGR